MTTQVASLGMTSDQLAMSFGDIERLAAKVAAATNKFRQTLADLDRSELSVAEKEKLRTGILEQQDQTVQRMTARHERQLAGMRAMEAAAGSQTGGMAVATASAGDPAGALDRNYKAADRLAQQQAPGTATAAKPDQNAKPQGQSADAEKLAKYASEVRDVAKTLIGGISENLYTSLTDRRKAMNVFDFFKSIFKKIAIAALESNIVLPIVTQVVGAMPSLFGIVAPSGATEAAGTATNGPAGSLTNTAVSKIGGWVMDKLGLTGGMDQLMNTTLIGNAGGWAAASAVPVSATAGSAITGGTSLNAATGIVNANNTVGANIAYSGTASGVPGSGVTLGGILGAAGAGAFGGGLVGGWFGTRTNSKAVGGVTGALAGAGAGYLSTIIGLSSLGGPVGAAIGAVVGAIMGMIGTQKATVGPTVSSGINRSADGKSVTSGGYLTDNGGDISEAQKLGDTIALTVNAALLGGGTLTRDLGIGRTERKGLYVSGSLPYKEFGEDVAGMFRYALLESGSLQDGGANTVKAIRNSKAKDFEGAAKDIALGASIDAGTTALDALDKSLNSFTKSAKEATAKSLKPMLEELERAKGLDLGSEYVSLATGQLNAYLDELRKPSDYTQVEQDMAGLKGQFQAIREAYQQLNPALAATVDQIEKETRARIQGNVQNDANRQLNSALDRNYVNSINDLIAARDINARNLTAVGLGPQRATEIFDASLQNVLKGLDASQLDVVATLFTGSIHDLALSMKSGAEATEAATAAQVAATAAAEKAAYQSDLSVRLHAAVGNLRGSGLLALDQQQAVEVARAKADGRDTSQLALVQAAERGQKAFDLAQADVLAWYDQEIAARQTFIGELQEGAAKVAAAARQFAAARDALAISQDAPISPQERLTEAKRQWDAALATVRSTTASEEDRDTARSNLTSLAQTLTGLEKESSAGTARTLYDEVMTVLGELGTLAPDSAAATADAQIKVAQDSLKELQKARTEAASVGQRQLGSLDGLQNTMGQSLAVWQAALSPLQTLTGTVGTTPRYSAPAAVQTAWDSLSTTQQGGIAQAMGWGGQVDEAFNFWLGSSAGRRSDFESRVLAAGRGGSAPRYGAPADVQSGWDGLSGAQQMGIVRAMGWTGAIDQAFNTWLATDGGRAATFESHVRTIAGGAVYSASADIMRAWEALSADQQAMAVRAAGYGGGVDAGLNAWVRLGHQADFESAVRARAQAAGIPGFSAGTLSTPPGAMWVGEAGPELLWQGGEAAVASSADSLRIAGMHRTAANDGYPPSVAPIRPPAGPLASDNREILAALRDIGRRIERLEATIHEAEGEAQTQRSRIAQDEITLMRQQLDELREQQVKRAA
ncbi:hypothetical protein EI613_18740 [Azospirillum sp. 412522]|nr:hypothetical protein [Azospirillum sp. 412522]MBY6263940.1 hypothetical protein [Azospirillum sp. 412522]